MKTRTEKPKRSEKLLPKNNVKKEKLLNRPERRLKCLLKREKNFKPKKMLRIRNFKETLRTKTAILRPPLVSTAKLSLSTRRS
jgi:hypothetical protein